MTGERFGQLTVVRVAERRSRSGTVWECRCDCGRVVAVVRGNLISGSTTSCGCRKLAVLRDGRETRHAATYARSLGNFIPEPNSGCLLWLGPYDRDGYGEVTRMRKFGERKAHRFFWSEKHGEIPSNMVVMHTCDTPPCVNIDHLCLGTALQNNDDKVSKRRQSRVISDETLRSALSDVLSGMSKKDAARRNGISYVYLIAVTLGRFRNDLTSSVDDSE